MDKDAPTLQQHFPSGAPEDCVRTAIAFTNLANETRTLDLSNRYETRFHRQFMRALSKLQELQDRRRRDGAAPESPARRPLGELPNEPSVAPEPPPTSEPAAASPQPASAVTDILPNEPGKSLEPKEADPPRTNVYYLVVGGLDLNGPTGELAQSTSNSNSPFTFVTERP